jgi:phage baseplate assembly protein W
MTVADPRGKAFMGRGWAFPVRIRPDSGEVDTALNEADIQQSIRIILGTSKGERVMRPDFGCGIHDLVFAAVDMATVTQIRQDVTEALRTYEARIEVTGVVVDLAALPLGRLEVAIDYRVRTTNQPGNYVYPFYFREAR